VVSQGFFQSRNVSWLHDLNVTIWKPRLTDKAVNPRSRGLRRSAMDLRCGYHLYPLEQPLILRRSRRFRSGCRAAARQLHQAVALVGGQLAQCRIVLRQLERLIGVLKRFGILILLIQT
jgi:hypothetical protein